MVCRVDIKQRRLLVCLNLTLSIIWLLPAHALCEGTNVVPMFSLLLFGDKDCDGVRNGTAFLDDCNGCVGGNTGNSPCGVVLSATGRIWLDRNLGATQVATSSTDSAAYGDLYQWGRLTDGHQSRSNVNTTSELSSTDVPGHAKFITSDSDPWNWRNPQNNNLWQEVSGANNPCPSGFRLPLMEEFEDERNSWVTNDSAGAFASPLKLVMAGYRKRNDGLTAGVGTSGVYWSSNVSNVTKSRILRFDNNIASVPDGLRAYGLSVRCIQD